MSMNQVKALDNPDLVTDLVSVSVGSKVTIDLPHQGLVDRSRKICPKSVKPTYFAQEPMGFMIPIEIIS